MSSGCCASIDGLVADLLRCSTVIGGLSWRSLRHHLTLGDLIELGIISKIPPSLMGDMVGHGSRAGLLNLVSRAQVQAASPTTARATVPGNVRSNLVKGEFQREWLPRRNTEGKLNTPKMPQRNYISSVFVILLARMVDLRKSSPSSRIRQIIEVGELDTAQGLEHTLCKYSKVRNLDMSMDGGRNWDVAALDAEVLEEDLYLFAAVDE